MGLLDVDRIYTNPIYTCTIQKESGAAGPQQIIGIYNSDSPFNIQINSEFVDQFDLPPAIQEGFNQLAGGANWIRNMQGRTQMILKSLRMTEQRWNGSSEPTFNVKIDIPIVRKTNAQWLALQYALQAVSGTLNENGGNGQVQKVESGWQIFAPNGYKVNYAGKAEDSDHPEGTHHIMLGSGNSRWFDMENAVITGISYAIGSKKYYDGNPTSVSLSIDFKYWRYPLYEQIIKWFPKIPKI